jgi:hypothetical protein
VPRVCRACHDAKVDEINSAIAEGRSFRNTAERFGLSLAGLVRHRQHVAGALAKTRETREVLSAERLVERLAALEREARSILTRAKRAGEHRTALVAVRELREQIEAVGRLAAVAALRQPSGPVTITVDLREADTPPPPLLPARETVAPLTADEKPEVTDGDVALF